MRIELLLGNPGRATAVPIDANHYLAGAIYRTLASSSHDYANHLHNQGYEFAGKRFKLFTFSRLLASDYRLANGQLILYSPVIRWQVSSPVDEFLYHFAEGILERGDLRVDSALFRVLEVRTLPDPAYAGTMRLRLLSPVTVSMHIDRPGMNGLHYCRLEDGFYERVTENLRRKYQLLTGNCGDSLHLRLEFDPAYVRRRRGKIQKIITYKETRIFAYEAPMIVEGDSELIRVGYECGFGDGNSKGLGMVEAG